ncbi:expressed protein [Echinococcus multilocularis]|uniref:Expressed protein n=1 Tax=Echinococcus multilocularis TaxID=6211 RepID=A0A068Y2M1_ECHMU|nr:expressed protein [Echinococcus multilocularis]
MIFSDNPGRGKKETRKISALLSVVSSARKQKEHIKRSKCLGRYLFLRCVLNMECFMRQGHGLLSKRRPKFLTHSVTQNHIKVTPLCFAP